MLPLTLFRLPPFSQRGACMQLSLCLVLHWEMLKALDQVPTASFQGLWKPYTACDFLIQADQTAGRVKHTLYIIFITNEVFGVQAVESFLTETWQANH